MNRRPTVYLTLLLVFLGSAAVGIAVPAHSVLREVSAVPALGALFAALFQIFRDQAAFERQLLLQQQQQAFSLGAASHMASVAFDKYAEFCEKYMAEVHLTFATLFQEGPTQKALNHASNLIELKRRYSVWLTKSTLAGLEPFEAALRKIGTCARLEEASRGTGDPEHQKAVNEMHEVFREVMQIGEVRDPSAERADVTIDAVEQKLRVILGVEQLTAIRQYLVERAVEQALGVFPQVTANLSIERTVTGLPATVRSCRTSGDKGNGYSSGGDDGQ